MRPAEAQAIAEDIAGFFDDPLGFVLYAFPWGEGDLADETGPDEWQREVLITLGAEVAKRECGDLDTAIQIAVASGHGIGKTAEIAWIILWFMSTRPHPQAVVTANTESQLTKKTWRELAKWHKRAINRDWFDWSATSFKLKESPDTWFASAIPWSEHNSEAFAGTHEKYVLVLFDEGSAIADIIWEVTEGAMTTPGAIWIAFGNPTKNTGRFKECFGRFRHRWITRQIDSRTAKMASKAQIDQWIADYGEDSDFVRVRVKGQFPRAGSNQFIPSDIVEACTLYEAKGWKEWPVIFGCDIARFGDDQTVILVRQGRKVHRIYKYRGLDTMQVAAHIYQLSGEWKPGAVMIDGVGVGSGVVDRCRQFGMNVFDVNAGEQATDKDKYRNKRAEMWGAMRDWIKAGAQIPKDYDLIADLTGVEYGFTPTNQILLEKKEDMKKRGLASPDCADALALTFAFPVEPDEPELAEGHSDYGRNRPRRHRDENTDPWAA